MVDEHDIIIGTEEKFSCHKRSLEEPFGKLHRAFSLFLFSSDCSQMLLQRRAPCKHTFPLAWTNAVFSHPNSNGIESDGISGIKRAVVRRAKEELGLIIEEQSLIPVGRMIYCAISCALYAEWELDYLIFAKVANGQDINPNPDEVADIKWICFEDLDGVMNKSPWFSKLIEGRVLQGLWKKFKEDQVSFDDRILSL